MAAVLLSVFTTGAALAPAGAQSGPAPGRAPSAAALAGRPALFRHTTDSVQWMRYTTLEDCAAAAGRLLHDIQPPDIPFDTGPAVPVPLDTTEARYRGMRDAMRRCIARLSPADGYAQRLAPPGPGLWRTLALASGDDALLAAVIDTQLHRVHDIVPTPPDSLGRLGDDTAAGATLADREVATEAGFLGGIVGELLRDRPTHMDLARRLTARFAAAHPDRPLLLQAGMHINFLTYARQQRALDMYTAEVDTILALSRRVAAAPPEVVRHWTTNEKAGKAMLPNIALTWAYRLALIRGGREAAKPWADSVRELKLGELDPVAPPITADHWQPAPPAASLPARGAVTLVLFEATGLTLWNASVVGRLLARYPKLSVVVVSRSAGQFRDVAVPDRAREAELRFQELAKQWRGRLTFAASVPPADTLAAPDGRIVRGKTAMQRAYAGIATTNGGALLVGPDGRAIDQVDASRNGEWFTTLLLDGVFARQAAPAVPSLGTNDGTAPAARKP